MAQTQQSDTKKKSLASMLPCVPGIVTFITSDIKPKFFPSFSFALSEPLMLRIHQKFKAQAREKHERNKHASVRSHTHADKIDRFVHIKKIISFTIYYSLLLI